MISIGLCMIVKNEEAVLRRILTPMSKLVDKIYICDTGSVDKTKEIAREFTDEVYDFLWKDDFSAARNIFYFLLVVQILLRKKQIRIIGCGWMQMTSLRWKIKRSCSG